MQQELVAIKEKIKKIPKEQKTQLYEVAEGIFKRQMDTIGMVSYMELFQEIAINMGQHFHAENNHRSVDPIIEKIHKKMIVMIGELPSILEHSEGKMEDVKNLRKEIVGYIRLLTAYYTEENYIYEILSEKAALGRLETKSSPKQLNLNAFYQDVARYLAQDIQQIPSKISNILSVIPFRFTKQSFLDQVEGMLKGAEPNTTARQWNMSLERYREHFSGTSYKDYGVHFTPIHERIEMWKVMEYKEKTLQEIEQILKEVKAVVENTTRLLHTFQSYCSILNRIIVLFDIGFSESNKILEGETTIPIAYKKFTGIKRKIEDGCNPEEIEKELSTLYEICREKNKGLYEEAQQLVKLFNQCMERLSGTLNDTLAGYVAHSQQLIEWNNDFYTQDYDVFFQKGSEGLDMNEEKISIQTFISSLNEELKGMKNDFRRARMRKLMAMLPIPFQSPEDFFDYLKNAMEFNTTSAEKMWMIYQIEQMMQQNTKLN